MHASSYIRYLKMSKSWKTDPNSYSAVGLPYSSDRRREKLNTVTKFPRVSLIGCLFSLLETLKPKALKTSLVGVASLERQDGVPTSAMKTGASQPRKVGAKVGQLWAWFRGEGVGLVTFTGVTSGDGDKKCLVLTGRAETWSVTRRQWWLLDFQVREQTRLPKVSNEKQMHAYLRSLQSLLCGMLFDTPQ